MSVVNIKVEIAGSVYPLKVEQNDEEHIREAVKLINNKILEFEKSYGVKDKKDLLGMVMLQLVTQLLSEAKGARQDLSNLRKLFTDVEGMLKDHSRDINSLEE